MADAKKHGEDIKHPRNQQNQTNRHDETSTKRRIITSPTVPGSGFSSRFRHNQS